MKLTWNCTEAFGIGIKLPISPWMLFGGEKRTSLLGLPSILVALR